MHFQAFAYVRGVAQHTNGFGLLRGQPGQRITLCETVGGGPDIGTGFLNVVAAWLA